MHTSISRDAVDTRAAVRVPLIVSEAEAATMLNLAPRTLQGKRLDGTGPRFIKISGRRIGYAVADLEAWITERSVGSTADATVRGIGGAK